MVAAAMNARSLTVLTLIALTFVIARTDIDVRALWPSLVAVVSVFLLRSALSGLLIGAAAGVVLLANGNPITAFPAFFAEHLIPSLQDKWKVGALIFTLLLGGFAALLEHGKGFDSILRNWLGGGSASVQRVQFSAYFMGLVCFFDGLASSLLTGKAIRPLADRVGISRAKLAYIVDSTSSAVACVAIMSTWIAFQLSMIREGYAQAKVENVQPFSIFVSSIPMNYYCWFTLLLLVVVIRRNWNPGPMEQAERFCHNVVDSAESSKSNPPKNEGAAWQVVIPLATLIISMLVGLYWNGVKGEALPFSLDKAQQAFGDAQSYLVLVYSSALACIVAFAANYHVIRRHENPAAIFTLGMQRFFVPCLILIGAWCLSSTLKKLGASDYLASLISENMPAGLFPATVFLLGVLISFTTGTSWGTMGVLMPLTIPAAFALAPGNESLVAPTVAAVFSGAVFGDHCSPLSDTTIVSSMACDLEPVEHIRTQIPYAVTAAAIATFVGFIPLGYGMHPLLGLAIGGILIIFLPTLHQRFKQRATDHG